MRGVRQRARKVAQVRRVQRRRQRPVLGPLEQLGDRRRRVDLLPGRHEVALREGVQLPQLHRVHAERRRQPVHLRLVAERRLHRAEAAHRPARRIVGVQRDRLHPDVRNDVRAVPERGRVARHRGRGGGVGAAVQHDPAVREHQPAVQGGPVLVAHPRRVAVHVPEERLVPGVHDLDRLPGVHCQQAGVDLHRQVLPAAERAAHPGQRQPDLLLRQGQHRGHLLPVHVQPLGGDVQVHPAVLGRHRQARLRAQERLVLHADLVLAADHHVRQRPHLVGDAPARDHPLLVADVAPRQRLVLVRLVHVAVPLRVEALLLGGDRVQHPVLHPDPLRRPAGRLRMVRGHQRHRLALVAHLVDRQGRLVGDLQPVELGARDVLVGEHRVHPRQRQRRRHVHRQDVRPRVRRAQRPAPQHVLVPQVRGVGELAPHLQRPVRTLRGTADAVPGSLVDLLQVLLAPHRTRRHLPSSAPEMREAASRTASMIFS